MRPAPRGFCLRLLIGARSRVYLPVDHGGALIGVVRYLRAFVSVHTLPLKQKYIAQSSIHPSIVTINSFSVTVPWKYAYPVIWSPSRLNLLGDKFLVNKSLNCELVLQ